MEAITVVHEDQALLVLDKPAGLLSVPGRGPDKQDCLARRAQQRWPDAQVVHRLDMATSGLVVMARGAAVQRQLSMAFEARAVDKRYQAVVAGRPNDDQRDAHGWCDITLALAADWPRRPLQRVDPEHGRPSHTRWRLLRHDASTGTTRLELEPLTGRTHQLRLHLQAIGHPIVGDALYADTATRDLSPRLLLHATSLALSQPSSGQRMRFESPAPF